MTLEQLSNIHVKSTTDIQDAFSLLDKVLLHEMAHGRSIYSLKDESNDYI